MFVLLWYIPYACIEPCAMCYVPKVWSIKFEPRNLELTRFSRFLLKMATWLLHMHKATIT